MWIPVLLLAACAERAVSDPPPSAPGDPSPEQEIAPAPTNVRTPDEQEYDFVPLLAFDAIRPIYDPEFVPADQSPLNADELILGISIGEEAKAYPITVLRFREIVNDELADLPILVTW